MYLSAETPAQLGAAPGLEFGQPLTMVKASHFNLSLAFFAFAASLRPRS